MEGENVESKGKKTSIAVLYQRIPPKMEHPTTESSLKYSSHMAAFVTVNFNYYQNTIDNSY